MYVMITQTTLPLMDQIYILHKDNYALTQMVVNRKLFYFPLFRAHRSG